MQKEKGPAWFKFWRKNRLQFDSEALDMRSRGVIITNLVRYFDGEEENLLPMEPIERLVFGMLKYDIDESCREYEEVCERNRARINARWHKKDTAGTDGIPEIPPV